MKNIILILSFLTFPCFANVSFEMEANLQLAWDFAREGNFKKAIALCTRWIEDERIKNVDKVHYLVARSNFHLSDQDKCGYDVDFEILKYLYFNYSDCAYEMWSCYEISFRPEDNIQKKSLQQFQLHSLLVYFRSQ
jgi:hypothetical protein